MKFCETVYYVPRLLLVSHRPLSGSKIDGHLQTPKVHCAFGAKHSSSFVQGDPNAAVIFTT